MILHTFKIFINLIVQDFGEPDFDLEKQKTFRINVFIPLRILAVKIEKIRVEIYFKQGAMLTIYGLNRQKETVNVCL